MDLRHVLIVDDDDEIRGLLLSLLSRAGYAVSTAKSSLEIPKLMTIFRFDAVILDVLMPFETGVEFLNRVNIKVPVLMLSALGNVDDRICGLESGASDYLAKPFEPKELLIRLKNLINNSVNKMFNSSIVQFGDFIFDLNKLLLEKKGIRIHLTTMEGQILKVLAKNATNIVSRDNIISQLREVNLRTIDAQIARIRTKLGENSKKPEFLQTIRHEGYVLWAKYVRQP